MAYQRGSGFVGLQQYLNANRQQGAAMGGAVAGRIEGAQQGVRDEGAGVMAGLQQAVDAGTPQYLEPNSVGDAERKAAATRYTGPEGLTDAQIAGLNASADKAEETARLGATDAGVATLLQQQYGQGYTGVGGRSLDAALARRGAGERLDAAPKGMAGLRSYLGGLPGQAHALVDRAKDITSGQIARYSGYQPPPTPDTRPPQSAIPSTAPERRAPGTTIGNIRVPGATPQINPVTIGNTVAGAPTPPKKGGQYIGGVWVPYT